MATRPSAISAATIPKFTELNNLVSAANGAEVLFATDDWFAAAENLLQTRPAEWKEGVFDNFGKWMDGWETRRKRIPGHDWCIIKLAYPSIIDGVDIDTSYFTGNFTPRASIQAANLPRLPAGFKADRTGENGKKATEEQFKSAEMLKSESWETIVPRTPLGAGYEDTCHNYFPVASRAVYTHIRLNMFPDGGIARLRVYGKVQRPLKEILQNAFKLQLDQKKDLIDLLAMENGGICLGYSDAHYGHPRNMIHANEPANMEEGWETARRLDRPDILQADKNGILQVPGCEWALFRLGVPAAELLRAQVDTTHFKGNFPDWFKLEGTVFTDEDIDVDQKGKWSEIIPPTKLGPNQRHFFDVGKNLPGMTHIRITIAPDGGIARLRLWGKPAEN